MFDLFGNINKLRNIHSDGEKKKIAKLLQTTPEALEEFEKAYHLGVGYDIGGICDSECDFYIPVSYIKEGLLDFLHIPGKVFNASQEYIDNAIGMFKKDLIESYHVTLL